MHDLELWGGHEFTVNRVGDAYMDQTRLSGHQERSADLDLFAGLGLQALRYPMLWERAAPDRLDQIDWRWTDERFSRIRELGLRPIAGLVHHGGGPRYTNLLDDGFAPGLAAYARACAERYPWIEDWTPVNEPLTTARFSALYGHWHPHRADEVSFWRAFLNQINGVRLAMAQIRQVNPAARLIQTEDLGRTYSTRAVAHQASFDNLRRWMTWDLLAGRVTPDHPLWRRISDFGFGGQLAAIAEAPCPADVIGVNHYLTSDRFLDHRCEDYPPERCGGNAFTRFADVEAIRVLTPAPGGLEGALQEAWERYGAPLAVTECHNGCTREEQVRWVEEAWETAGRLRTRGIDIRAVTAWSLLGAYDWNTLLTRPLGHYESGVFDVRGGTPRPTALAATLAGLRDPARPPHPTAQGAGWWRRDIRLQYRPVFRTVDTPEPRREWRQAAPPARPLLIAGATGTLGKALARACEWRGIDYVLTDRAQLDLTSSDSIADALGRHQPWAAINAAGWVRVDDAEQDETACLDANTHGAIRLAQACQARDIATVGFSSDLVFDGALDRPHVESDPIAPLNGYGRSKALAEAGIMRLGGRHLMVRTAAFFSPYDPHNFAAHVIRTLAADQTVEAADDLVVSPTYVPDLVDAVLDLAIDGETGLWHLANTGAVTWAEFAVKIALALNLDPSLVRPVPSARFGWPAARPARAALTSERGLTLPSLDNAIGRHAAVITAAAFVGDAEAQVDQHVPSNAFGGVRA